MVSYLKGDLLLLKNYKDILADTMGLINDVMTSADCKGFTKYMKSIYFASKRHHTIGGYMEYLDTEETK